MFVCACAWFDLFVCLLVMSCVVCVRALCVCACVCFWVKRFLCRVFGRCCVILYGLFSCVCCIRVLFNACVDCVWLIVWSCMGCYCCVIWCLCVIVVLVQSPRMLCELLCDGVCKFRCLVAFVFFVCLRGVFVFHCVM